MAHSSKFSILHLTASIHMYLKKIANIESVVKRWTRVTYADYNQVVCASDEAVECEVCDQ